MMYTEEEIQWAEERIDELMANIPTDPRPQGLLALWKWSNRLQAATDVAIKGFIQQMTEEGGEDNG